MKNKVVIFDFDGTIADTFSTVVEIVNSLADEFGYEKMTLEQISTLRHHRAQELLKIFKISLFKIPTFVVKVRMLLGEQVAHLKPFEGMPEAISQLKERGYTLGILSTNSVETIEAFLKRNNIQGFDFIYSEKNIFGKANTLKKLIKAHGFDKNDVIYVGDETRDAEAAHKAGVKAISVSWGFNTARALEGVHPDALISRPEELVAAVNMLG